MRISAKADYAVRAMIEIARAGEGASVTADVVAAAQGMPRTFLLAILADLRRAGLVSSRRGQAGGWTLSRPPAAISVADVIRAVDGPLASVQGRRPEALGYGGAAAALQTVWVALRAGVREVLEAVSLDDLACGDLPASVARRAAAPDAWTPH